jgi:hypothetical protein
MNDYLSNVAARNFNLIEPIQARLASRFEPLPAVDWPLAAGPSESEPGEESRSPAGIAFAAAPWSISPAVVMPPTTAPQMSLTTSPGLLTASQPPASQPTPPQPTAPLATGPTATGNRPGQDAVHTAPWSHTHLPTSTGDEARQPEGFALPPIWNVPPGTSPTALASSSEALATPDAIVAWPAVTPPGRPVGALPPTAPTVRAPSSGPPATPGTVIARPAVTPSDEPVMAVRPATPTVSPPVPQSVPPAIRVTIGRIDVRAVMPPAPPAPRSRPSRPGPTLSLKDYLQQRREGRR